MRLYLDVSCLNRPFDDQRQARIRAEAEAILGILKQIDIGRGQLVSSEIIEIEVDANPDRVRRTRVRALLAAQDDRIALTDDVVGRGVELERLGFKSADALHVASAESARVVALLTCDDRLLRTAERHRTELHIRVANPTIWFAEHENAGHH